MKRKNDGMTALALVTAAVVNLTSCSSTSKPPPPVGSGWLTYTKGKTGGVRVQTIKITAAVTAIDKARRHAMLRTLDGKVLMVKASPEVSDHFTACHRAPYGHF